MFLRSFPYLLVWILSTNALQGQIENSQVLDLNMAVSRALDQSPQLGISSSEAHARRAERMQATFYPNPVFSYEVENFAGNRNWKGFDNREERIFLGQIIETGGKRGARIKAASYQYYAALVGYESSKLNLLNRLTKAFINVAGAQEYLLIARDQTEIAKEILRIAAKKVEVGKVSLIQQKKAEVAFASAELEFEKAKTEFNQTKRKLAYLWGSHCLDFEAVAFPFFEVLAPVSFNECLVDLCNQPEILQSVYAHFNAHENWRFERARRIPDVSVSLGYKGNYGDKDYGMLAGVSVPLPLTDLNQGNIRKAYFDMLKTGEQGRQLWLLLETKLANSYEAWVRSYHDIEKIRESILKSASESLSLAEKGYREGKLEYLDVLDAQRTLFEIRMSYIRSLVNYHHLKADIDYLNSQTE